MDRSFIASIFRGGRQRRPRPLHRRARAQPGTERDRRGIETPEQLERLRTLGCEYGQGFLFSRAVSAERMGELLPSWPPPRPRLVPQPA
jgi:EAL domain-containing protein (putative c-di-GMP-specific phosphodiesterase class I)